ncbi:MAG: hypothetical protein GY947_20545 [Rhodobacteraceae bacterium]|nr:hypothetical protein [Paracoccaceae bacterium]
MNWLDFTYLLWPLDDEERTWVFFTNLSMYAESGAEPSRINSVSAAWTIVAAAKQQKNRTYGRRGLSGEMLVKLGLARKAVSSANIAGSILSQAYVK